jgi:hypothetical protein
MLKKNLLMLSVSAMFAGALIAPSAALAQFGPPPGPPPALAGPPLLVSAPGARLWVWAAAVALLLALWAHLRAISQVLHLISPG